MGVLTAVLVVLVSTFVNGQQGYQQISVNLHNEHRARHRVGPLSLTTDLNNRAVQCAQYYVNLGTIDHSCPHKNGAGENLWAQWGGSPSNDQVATSSANAFYSEHTQHDYNGDWQPGSGHFSQMVWKSSQQYGFGVAGNGNFHVGCSLYSPHGNVLGQFRDNVFPPL